MNEGVFSVSASNLEIGLSQKGEYKICSFSGMNALKSQLMWGHYANAGMGVAIELEVSNCSQIHEVVYNDSTENLNNVKAILTRKSLEWAHEEEFRYLSKNQKSKVKFGKISKIYFGTPYRALINYDEIEKNHEKLKEYLKQNDRLKAFSKKKRIETEDYGFSSLRTG